MALSRELGIDLGTFNTQIAEGSRSDPGTDDRCHRC